MIAGEEMTNEEKKRYTIYGQLVVEFANANSPIDAFNSLTSNWKKAHDCSGAIDLVSDFYATVITTVEDERQEAIYVQRQLVSILTSFTDGISISEMYDLKPFGQYLSMFNEAETIERMNYLFTGVSETMYPHCHAISYETALISLMFDRQALGMGEHCEDILSYCLVGFSKHFKGKLKRCPYCNLFFIADNAKRKICYSNPCFKEYKRLQRQRLRATKKPVRNNS